MTKAPADILTLPDGGRVLLRPIRPDDAQRLREGFERLSPRSRYQRFLSSVDQLSDAQVQYLTEIDYSTHNAIVALDPDREGQPGIGVARYIRLTEDPSVAEAAVTVTDDYQARGIGTLLLSRLADVARADGVEVFRNYVLTDNAAMINLLKDLGGTVRTTSHGIVEIDLPLGDAGEEPMATPVGQALREAGRGRVVEFIVEHLPFVRGGEREESGSDPGVESDPWLRDWFDAADRDDGS